MRIVLLIAVILIFFGSGLYMTTQSFDNRANELARLETQIASEDQQSAILNAEWSYLSRPERVLNLSSTLLSLQPISTDRVLPLEAIPFRDDSFVERPSQ